MPQTFTGSAGSLLGPMKPGQGKQRTRATESRQAVLNCQHCPLCSTILICVLSQEASHTCVNSVPHDCPKFCRAPSFTLFPGYNRRTMVKHSASDTSIFFHMVTWHGFHLFLVALPLITPWGWMILCSQINMTRSFSEWLFRNLSRHDH